MRGVQRQLDVALLGARVAGQDLARDRRNVVEVFAVGRLLPLAVDEVVVLGLEVEARAIGVGGNAGRDVHACLRYCGGGSRLPDLYQARSVPVRASPLDSPLPACESRFSSPHRGCGAAGAARKPARRRAAPRRAGPLGGAASPRSGCGVGVLRGGTSTVAFCDSVAEQVSQNACPRRHAWPLIPVSTR
ncbi:hypothetical protein D9M68_566700 [compost metagenome]